MGRARQLRLPLPATNDDIIGILSDATTLAISVTTFTSPYGTSSDECGPIVKLVDGIANLCASELERRGEDADQIEYDADDGLSSGEITDTFERLVERLETFEPFSSMGKPADDARKAMNLWLNSDALNDDSQFEYLMARDD